MTMKKNRTRHGAMLVTCILASVLFLTCCKNNESKETSNPAGLINDPAKLEMIHSLVDLEGDKGRLYEMTYTVDYKLEDALNAGIVGTNTLIQFVMGNLLDGKS